MDQNENDNVTVFDIYTPLISNNEILMADEIQMMSINTYSLHNEHKLPVLAGGKFSIAQNTPR